MPFIYSSFTIDGRPRDGAVANLYPFSAISPVPSGGSAAEGGTPPPATGILQTTTTGLQHGGDGAYRFAAGSGQYWVGISWNGEYAWDYHNIASAAIQSIQDYGADPTGVGDSTAAVRNAVIAANGGRVYVPAGTYTINPSGLGWIALTSNTTLYGDGDSSVLKIAASAGNYESVFSSTQVATLVQNLSIHDLKIDQNTSQNTSAAVASSLGFHHHVFKFFNIQNVRIERVTFDAMDGVNTITINGTNCKNAAVNFNRFNWLPIGGTVTYDNSAVYLDCENHQAIGNLFTAAPSGNARGCIETHNGPSAVKGNLSVGYRTGVNVVSVATGNSVRDRLNNDLNVCGNTFTACCQGITLWPVTGKQLSNVNISENVIDLSQVDHNQLTSHGIAWADDAVNFTVSGSTDGVVIANNVITFQTEGVSGGRTIDSFHNYGIGVGAAGPVSNVQVHGNIIRNASLKGIVLCRPGRVGNTLRNCFVKNNVLVDCGSASGFVADGNRIAIQISGPCINVRVTHNNLIDTGDSSLNGFQSFNASSSSLSGSGNVISQNNLWTYSGLPYTNSISPNTAGLLTQDYQIADTIRASGHLHLDGAAPTFSAGTGSGTTPTIAVSGSDHDGVIDLTTGTNPSSGATVLTVTFAKAFETAPRCVILTPGNSNAAALSGSAAVRADFSNLTAAHFLLSVGSTPLAGATEYIWHYHVGG